MMVIQSEEEERTAGEISAKQMRAAMMLAKGVPYAKVEPIGVGAAILQPGERAVLPIKWNEVDDLSQVSTHPDAQQGLLVLPGTCEAKETMSVVVENTSPLPIMIADDEVIAVGMPEEELPTLDECAAVQEKQRKFCEKVDWNSRNVGHQPIAGDKERVI